MRQNRLRIKRENKQKGKQYAKSRGILNTIRKQEKAKLDSIWRRPDDDSAKWVRDNQ